MNTAFGYVRVSTQGQVMDGVSLDAQRQKIQAWTVCYDFKLQKIFVDEGMSGGRADNRPGLQDAIAAACENSATLIVYSLSRLTRSVMDALAIADRLRKAGADLVSLSERIDTTTAAGKLQFHMIAVFHEFERNSISERTRMAMQFKKSRGERVGTVPFGWDARGKKLVANDVEQRVIKRMLELRAEGQSLRVIAKWLEKCGVKTKTGNTQWTACTVRTIMERKVIPPVI